VVVGKERFEHVAGLGVSGDVEPLIEFALLDRSRDVKDVTRALECEHE